MPKPYRRITKEEIIKFKAAEAIHGNGSAAIRDISPEYKNRGDRAYHLRRKAEELNPTEYVVQEINRGAVRAIERVQELVESDDEQVATRNAHFLIDHSVGKAVQRSENHNVNLNIQSVLE